MSWLYDIDLSVFRFGNEGVANPVFDVLFPFITDTHFFYLIYGVAVLSLLLFDGKRGVIAVVLLALLITASDQLSSATIKPLVSRIRPCAALDAVRLLVPCGPGKSFPSSHAVNNFAMAFLLARLYRDAAWYLFVYAGLVAFSRVYTGVHYPSDILAGSAIGCAVAWCLLWLHGYADRFAREKLNWTALSPPPRQEHG